MFNDAYRPFKEQNQKVAQDWIAQNMLKKKFYSVGISGGNAINSVRSLGAISKDITLYEIEEETAKLALKNYTSNKSSYTLPIKFIYGDIYEMDYTKYDLFYFDFCNVYKTVKYSSIVDGIKRMVEKKQPKQFAVMFTLPIRGKGVTKKATFKAFKKFAENVVISCTYYSVKTPDSLLSYRGGETGTGMNLTTFPMIFTRTDFDTAHRDLELFKRKKFADVSTTEKKNKKFDNNTHKEITKLILSHKYTNKQIAEKYGVSVHTIAAMAAHHVGKFLKNKKK